MRVVIWLFLVVTYGILLSNEFCQYFRASFSCTTSLNQMSKPSWFAKERKEGNDLDLVAEDEYNRRCRAWFVFIFSIYSSLFLLLLFSTVLPSHYFCSLYPPSSLFLYLYLIDLFFMLYFHVFRFLLHLFLLLIPYLSWLKYSSTAFLHILLPSSSYLDNVVQLDVEDLANRPII